MDIFLQNTGYLKIQVDFIATLIIFRNVILIRPDPEIFVMNVHIQRIIKFLRLNNNHYFEASDIAYHLRMDDINAVNALQYLAVHGLVISSHDTNGNIVWYSAEHGNHNKNEPIEKSVPEPSDSKDRSSYHSANQSVIVDNNSFSINLIKKHFPSIAGAAAVIIAILAVSGVFWAKWYIDKKFLIVMDVARSAVPMQEYIEFREQCLRRDERMRLLAGKLYLQIDTVTKKIDTVNSRIDMINQSNQSIHREVSGIRTLLRRR